MGRNRRSRSSEERRNRDRWYEARENEREAEGYDSDSSYESEPEPENPFVRMHRLLDLIAAAKDPNVRINIITELLHMFLSNQEIMIRGCSEGAYKRFTGVVQAKCAEFAAHPATIGRQGFQDLLRQVATAYR